MPIVSEFNAQNIHAPATVNFPRPFVAPPRLSHGFCLLDISKDAAIRAKSTVKSSTRHWADCHISTWYGTTLHDAVGSLFSLAPNNLDFLTGEHVRDPTGPSSVRIDFERPFVTPPKVVVFLNFIDLGNDNNWRLKTTAAGIDANGFTLSIETWGDTVLFGAKACWIAYPEDREHIFSTSVDTTEVRPPYMRQHQQSRAIEFSGVEFWKDPSVFVALNSFDIDHRANFRVNTYADNVSKTGLVWHIDSWSDTILYSAGASIIAFN